MIEDAGVTAVSHECCFSCVLSVWPQVGWGSVLVGSEIPSVSFFSSVACGSGGREERYNDFSNCRKAIAQRFLISSRQIVNLQELASATVVQRASNPNQLGFEKRPPT